MIVTHEPPDLEHRPRAVALGTFDGVHVGHRELIARVVRSSLRSTVVTFDPHPRLVMGRDVALVSSLDRRLELLEAAGVDDVLVVDFSPAVARLSAERWVAGVLTPIGTRRVVIGENFRFGHRRSGDAATLRALGFDVVAVPLLLGASSSRVRELVAGGRLVEAQRCLGRPFELEGVVVPPPPAPADVHPEPGGATPRLRLDAGMARPPAGAYVGRLAGRHVDVELRADGPATLRTAGAELVGARVRVPLLEAAAGASAVRERGRITLLQAAVSAT